MKKIISIAVAILMLASLVTIPTFAADELQFVSPDETWGVSEDGNYYIADVADLLAFSISATMEGFYAGKTVKLTEDIDMTGIEWYPVTDFRGTFDGDGHAIKGVSLTAQTGKVAFFTRITNATIQNIRFLDFSLTIATADNSNCAAVVAVACDQVNTLKNVYTSGTVTNASVKTSGMVGYPNTANTGLVKIENCVSAVKLVGQRCGGFVAQVPNLTTVEITDSAFIGDLTEASRWSSGFTGLTTGSVKLTRCISYCNGISSNTEDIGSFVFLDHQNVGALKDGTQRCSAVLEDCYAVVASDGVAIGTEKDRGYSYDLTIKYNGETTYEKQSTAEDTLTADRASIEAATKYIAKGGTVNVTKANFATELAVFTGWTTTEQTIEYMSGKTADVFLPTVTKELMENPFEPKAPEVTPDDGNGEGEGENQTPDGGNENENENQTPNDENKQTETNAPETQAPETQAPAEEKGGCFGSIGVSAAAVFALAGGAMLIARKKKED